ncbi:MAG: hypothetical protein LUI87_04380 [Lachnospiraceae bacterium]|nr:hypothetical protein [Lachnospiraceae bacterium]
MWELLEEAGIVEPKCLTDWAALNPEKEVPPQAVTTICNGKKHVWDTRDEAEDFFRQVIDAAEEPERKQYINIFVQLRLGLDVCGDME